MRMERVYLKMVGPFDEVTIEFPPGKDPAMADVYLLTGPNGCGKSTVLYAIAAALGGGMQSLGRDFVSPRLRGAESLAVAEIQDPEAKTGSIRYAVGPYVDPKMPPVADPFAAGSARTIPFVDSEGASVYYFSQHDQDTAYGRRATPLFELPRFAWVAFAYAGLRPVDDVVLTSIEEPKSSPFKNSLSFTSTVDTRALANWIASQQFKRFKAKEAGRIDRAEQLARSISDIERIIAEIVEDPTFAFVTTDEDNNVRIRREGKVIDLGLLPDGVKSIVSWIADLLMRLDRIPWIDETPPMQRPFLLLLDEIDIHLHPAWQRKVLPIVQRMFPNAQIIASTHSPFVVASAADAHIIALGVKDGVSTVESNEPSQLGVSYSAVLRSIFGITSEFDVDTERRFQEFHEAKARLFGGEASARADLDRLAAELGQRGEEVGQLIAIELRQLDRQLAHRIAK
jgi:predicted ATP-binding protein involved in virulence